MQDKGALLLQGYCPDMPFTQGCCAPLVTGSSMGHSPAATCCSTLSLNSPQCTWVSFMSSGGTPQSKGRFLFFFCARRSEEAMPDMHINAATFRVARMLFNGTREAECWRVSANDSVFAR